jgi:hypothetical protein
MTKNIPLIFSISRLDVWPVGDFAVRAGVPDLFGFDHMPSSKELEEIAEPWRPYRSVAAWYIWRSRGFVPQSGMNDGTPAVAGENLADGLAGRGTVSDPGGRPAAVRWWVADRWLGSLISHIPVHCRGSSCRGFSAAWTGWSGCEFPSD